MNITLKELISIKTKLENFEEELIHLFNKKYKLNNYKYSDLLNLKTSITKETLIDYTLINTNISTIDKKIVDKYIVLNDTLETIDIDIVNIIIKYKLTLINLKNKLHDYNIQLKNNDSYYSSFFSYFYSNNDNEKTIQINQINKILEPEYLTNKYQMRVCEDMFSKISKLEKIIAD